MIEPRLEYKVVVRATDPSGEADNITVTITAENVNEDPIVTGRAEISVPELTDGVYVSLPDAPDVQPQNDGSRTYTENEYVFEEPDHLDSIADWQLEGDDAAAFDLSGGFEPRYIQFKEAPDFENPTDANNDNVYEVTLVATDTGPWRGRCRHRQGKRVANRHQRRRRWEGGVYGRGDGLPRRDAGCGGAGPR